MAQKEYPAKSSYRLVTWYPSLHQKFGEQLYFFVIKPDTYNNWFKMTVEQVLRGCDVHGWCLYEIYGFYDILIRAWMSHGQRQSFKKELEKEANVSRFEDFLIHEIDYLWSNFYQRKPHLDEKILNKYTTEKLISVQAKEENRELSEKLQKCGLVLKDVIIDVDKSFKGIKFYIMIDYSAGAYHQSDLYNELKEFVDNKHDNLRELSIYSGTGFSKFMIKGICDFNKLYDIAEFSLRVISRFKLLKMQSHTMIVATRRSFESDNINFKNLSLFEVNRIIKEFNLDKEKVKDLSKYELRSIKDKYEEIQHSGILYDNNQFIMRLFNDYVNKDAASIQRNLYIMLEFEQSLRSFSLKIMAKLYGSDWVKTDFGRISKSVEMVQKNINKLSLYDWISILGKADSERKKISNILGEDWEPVLKKAATLRNHVAHARLEDPVSMWTELIDFIIEFLPLYGKIQKWSSEQGGKH